MSFKNKKNIISGWERGILEGTKFTSENGLQQTSFEMEKYFVLSNLSA